MKEIWKEIIGYEGLYQVSNLGNVKSKLKDKKLVLTNKGYYRAYLSKNKQQKSITVHRLVAMAFIKNKFEYPQVNHKNGIKTDNRAENLEWCSNRQNINHAIKNNLYSSGESHYKHKLNKRQVIEIFKSSDRIKDISAKYGIDKATIYCIKNRISWKNLLVDIR